MGHETDGVDLDKAFRIFLVVSAGNVHGGQILVVQGRRTGSGNRISRALEKFYRHFAVNDFLTLVD